MKKMLAVTLTGKAVDAELKTEELKSYLARRSMKVLGTLRQEGNRIVLRVSTRLTAERVATEAGGHPSVWVAFAS